MDAAFRELAMGKTITPNRITVRFLGPSAPSG